MYSKSSRVEFLIGTSLTLNLIRKLRSTINKKPKFLCFFDFFIIVSTKRKPQRKTIFNHLSHWFCINFFKCWIQKKILPKKTLRYMYRSTPLTNHLHSLTETRFPRTPHDLNPLSVNPTKWSNTLKQLVGKLPTNCLSVFDHFGKLAHKGLKKEINHVYETFILTSLQNFSF